MAEETLVAADAITSEPTSGGTDEYDFDAGKKMAEWIWEIYTDDARAREQVTREGQWAKDWKFLRGSQWEGAMPSFRRPIVMNAWRRAYHMEMAVALGGRPTLKIVPQGGMPEEDLATWQDALWAVQKREHFFDVKVPDAYSWAFVGDGGVLKFGYGSWAPGVDPADVMITAPHPGQVFLDPDCTDLSLTHCNRITYWDRLDLATISGRYPVDQMQYVKADGGGSVTWAKDVPVWAPKKDGMTTITPAGGWTASGKYKRGLADVLECWIDDPARETYTVSELVNLGELVQAWLRHVERRQLSYEDKDKLVGLELQRNPTAGYQGLLPELTRRLGGPPPDLPEPIYRDVRKWRISYPFGRLVTCTRDVTLRDIPNPYGKAWGWAQRWPFVFVPGAMEPHTVWRPGLLAGMSDLQWAINKALSLLLENAIKVTNAMVIADDTAIDEDEWDLLQLFPGVKIRKTPGSEVSVVFPQPLPPQAFQLADYLIRKLEEAVGLQDPPIAPGQAVAAKTVAFMQQKGSFMMGIVAKGFDDALERGGSRIMGLMRDRYLPGRMIPYFEGKAISPKGSRPLPELPASTQLRVEATSAYQEMAATAQIMAQAAEAARAERK